MVLVNGGEDCLLRGNLGWSGCLLRHPKTFNIFKAPRGAAYPVIRYQIMPLFVKWLPSPAFCAYSSNHTAQESILFVFLRHLKISKAGEGEKLVQDTE